MINLKRDAVLGSVFFGGLILLLFLTWKFGKFGAPGGAEYPVLFENNRFLKEGDAVFLLGKEYGSVKRIEVLTANRRWKIRVTVGLNTPISFRGKYDSEGGYRIRIQDASVLGGKVVAIDPGQDGEPVPDPEAGLYGYAPKNALEQLGDFFSSGDTKKNLDSVVAGIAELIEDVRLGRGTIGKLFQDEELYKNATRFFEGIAKAIEDANAGKGTLGKLLTDDALYSNATAFFAGAREITDEATKGDGIVKRLLKDKTMADNLDAILEDMKSVAEDLEQGRGMLGKAINDPKIAQQFANIVDNIDNALSPEAKGLVARLLHDVTLGAKVDQIVDDVAQVTHQIRSGEGTLGKFIMDDALYVKFEKLIDQISFTVEDVREAAPVQTFFSVFGGVFQ